MFDLFTEKFSTNILPIMGALFETTKRTYLRELDKIVTYNQEANFFVENQHLLCRILETGTPPILYDIDRFMEACSARAPAMAKNFQLTGEQSYGIIHKGVFYGEGSSEILLSIEDYFDPREWEADWKNLVSIKVLEHCMTDLGMLVPVGKRISVETGLAVLSIDLPKLYFQYRCFLREQMKQPEGSRQDKRSFVRKYVLPHIVRTQTDIAIRNRLMNMFYDIPMGASLGRHPISVSDYTGKVDSVLRQLLPKLKGAKLLYQNTMTHIPSVTAEDGYSAELIPDLVPTAQCRWAIYLTRLGMIKFLWDLGGEEGRYANGTQIRAMQIETKRLSNDPTFISRVPKDIAYDVVIAMREIKSRT